MIKAPETLIGSSRPIQELQLELPHAARSDAKILITGESGVGKEVVAHLIHQESGRRRAPFVTINCAGVPDTLLESELFGHARGSFTGAYRDKPGLLERAHGGTVFLDEVGEMSLRMQGLLLRFLETGEIQRVGSAQSEARVDVRTIAATNRHLPDMISTGAFREDLFYRLNVIQLSIPPLRERTEDIEPLMLHFLAEFAARYDVPAPRLSPDVLLRLVEHPWPGNVRELRNLAERVIVRGPAGALTVADLPAHLVKRVPASEPVPAAARTRSVADALYERMVSGGESFWTVVYAPFMTRDLTRDDIRAIVSRGLQETHGSYKALVHLFNMPGDYKRFLNFLRKHDCHLPFQGFRGTPVRVSSSDPPAPFIRRACS